MKSSLTSPLIISGNFAGSTFKINPDPPPLPVGSSPHHLYPAWIPAIACRLASASIFNSLVSIQWPNHVTSHLSSASVSPSRPGTTHPKSLLRMIRSFVIWPLLISPKSLSLLFPLSTACYSGPGLHLPHNNHITLSRPLHVRSRLSRKLLQRYLCVASYTSS